MRDLEERAGAVVEAGTVAASLVERLRQGVSGESETERARAEQAERARAIELMLSQAGLEAHRHCTLRNFDPHPDEAALRVACEYVRAVEGWIRAGRPNPAPSLYLASERSGETIAPGNGKTHLAVGVMRALAERGHLRIYREEQSGLQWSSFQMISSPRLIQKIQSTYGRADHLVSPAERVGRYFGAELLVLDDLGTEKDTDDARGHLFELMDRRITRPTIYTSNYSPDALARRSVEWAKLVSRMRTAMRGTVLRGHDRRRPTTNPWAKYTEAAE